tara:strand:+ start:455 stop:1123 length:669 start_codon:yes stop_codon:yes gene_type:complete
MAKEFYNKLINYVSANDTSNANALLMKEVGKSLVKDKSNFIELLTSSNIAASESMSDMELVDAFINNLPTNKSLMIGTAYLINSDNKFLSADGSEQISDKGVKVCYNVMYENFSGEQEEEHSNVIAAAVIGAVGGLAALGSKIAENKGKKKYGTLDALSKKQEGKQQMIQSILAERKAKLDAETKIKEGRASKTKILLIIAGSVMVLGVIGFIIYKLKKGKQ